MAIATVFFKNIKEHSTILDANNHDTPKKTDIFMIDKNNKQTHETTPKQKKDGYQPKNYRGTDIETAAWEDSAFEKSSGKIHTNSANIIDDFPDFELTHAPHIAVETPKNTTNGVQNSLLDSIVIEIKSNYNEHGISSGLKTTSFEERLKEKRESTHSASTGIAI